MLLSLPSADFMNDPIKIHPKCPIDSNPPRPYPETTSKDYQTKSCGIRSGTSKTHHIMTPKEPWHSWCRAFDWQIQRGIACLRVLLHHWATDEYALAAYQSFRLGDGQTFRFGGDVEGLTTRIEPFGASEGIYERKGGKRLLFDVVTRTIHYVAFIPSISSLHLLTPCVLRDPIR